MTKNLKLAIAILATVTSMNVNAQKKATVKTTKPKTEIKTAEPATESKTTKPTKQETMDWIGGKMKENLGKYREFISYTNGIFIYKKPYLNGHCTTTINLNNVMGMSSEYSKDFYVTGKDFYLVECDNLEKRKENNQELSISGPNYNDYGAPFNFTPDQSLVERLRKAFATLIEYNSTKKRADEKF